MYMCFHTYINTYIHIHTHTYTHSMSVCVGVHLFVSVYVYIFVHVHVWMYRFMNVSDTGPDSIRASERVDRASATGERVSRVVRIYKSITICSVSIACANQAQQKEASSIHLHPSPVSASPCNVCSSVIRPQTLKVRFCRAECGCIFPSFFFLFRFPCPPLSSAQASSSFTV